MADIEVVFVDKLEIICTCSPTAKTSWLFNTIQQHTRIESDLLVLYSSTGSVLNKNTPLAQQLMGATKLFLFRKNFINICYTKYNPVLEDFNAYPFPKSFGGKMEINWPKNSDPTLEKIKIIESKLFTQSNTAKEIYARYMTQKEKFCDFDKLVAIRLEVSSALLLNIKQYYKHIKSKYQNMNDQARALQRTTLDKYKCFENMYEEVIYNTYGSEVDVTIRQRKFKEFGYRVYSKTNDFCNKIQNLKNTLLKSISKEIKTSEKSLGTIEMTNMQFLQLPLYAILCSHEDSIRGALSMVEPYNQFKELYKLAKNQFSQSEKKKYLDKIAHAKDYSKQ